MKKVILFLGLSALFGCELVVDVDMPVEKQQLVLSSLFNPDSLWVAKLTLNRHILDNGPFMTVDDAEIIVYDGDTALDTLNFEKEGFYRSNTITAKAGKEFKIIASAPEYNTVTCVSTTPMPVVPTMSAVQESTDVNGQREFYFSLNFTDPPGPNFYQVVAIGEYRYQNQHTGREIVNRAPSYVWTDDPGIDNEDIPNNEGFFFPDALFSNQEFTVNVKMAGSWWSAGEGVKYFIIFRTVSEEYYKYKTTSLLQDYVSGDPFAQPVKVYNNVDNGFGIFAGFSQTVFEFKK